MRVQTWHIEISAAFIPGLCANLSQAFAWRVSLQPTNVALWDWTYIFDLVVRDIRFEFEKHYVHNRHLAPLAPN